MNPHIVATLLQRQDGKYMYSKFQFREPDLSPIRTCTKIVRLIRRKLAGWRIIRINVYDADRVDDKNRNLLVFSYSPGDKQKVDALKRKFRIACLLRGPAPWHEYRSLRAGSHPEAKTPAYACAMFIRDLKKYFPDWQVVRLIVYDADAKKFLLTYPVP